VLVSSQLLEHVLAHMRERTVTDIVEEGRQPNSQTLVVRCSNRLGD
jgi:hypothetical protein